MYQAHTLAYRYHSHKDVVCLCVLCDFSIECALFLSISCSPSLSAFSLHLCFAPYSPHPRFYLSAVSFITTQNALHDFINTPIEVTVLCYMTVSIILSQSKKRNPNTFSCALINHISLYRFTSFSLYLSIFFVVGGGDGTCERRHTLSLCFSVSL